MTKRHSVIIAKAVAVSTKMKKSTADEEYNFLNTVLAMYMDLGLSKAKYEILRSYNLSLFNNKNYPPYKKLSAAKEDCYPNNTTITECGAYVHLQSLLDHTVNRIVCSIDSLNDADGKKFVLYGKWGMDEASGQQTVKQRWNVDMNQSCNEKETSNLSIESSTIEAKIPDNELSDKSVFIISFVPLRIIAEENGDILWTNNRSSFIRYCRPIKFDERNCNNNLTRVQFLCRGDS